MEQRRYLLMTLFLAGVAAIFFSVGIFWSMEKADAGPRKTRTRIIFKKKTKLDFEGLDIEGELKGPAEFYFKHRPPEKFNSLVSRRKNFHREMLRDVAITK